MNEKYIKMKSAGSMAAQILEETVLYTSIGVTTSQINEFCKARMEFYNTISASYGYNGTYPGHCCISVNNQLCHGTPSDYTIKYGDVVSIDVALSLDGYFGDTCVSFIIGNGNVHLVKSTWNVVHKTISHVKPGISIGTLGHFMEKYANKYGYNVSDVFCGHFIGKKLHMLPDIPFNGKKNSGYVLQEGDCFTIEPIVLCGVENTQIADDNWTAYNPNGNLSAQFEHTIYVTHDGYEILTKNTIFDMQQQFIIHD